jgi:hypothetical protein
MVQARDMYCHSYSDLRVRGRKKLHRPAFAASSKYTTTACRLPCSLKPRSTCRKRDIKVDFIPRIPLRLVEEGQVHEQAGRRLPGVGQHGATVPQGWRRQVFKGSTVGRRMLMTMSCLIAHPCDYGPCLQPDDAAGP